MIDAVYEWRSSCRGGSSRAFRLCVLIVAHLRRPLHSRCFRETLILNGEITFQPRKTSHYLGRGYYLSGLLTGSFIQVMKLPLPIVRNLFNGTLILYIGGTLVTFLHHFL